MDSPHLRVVAGLWRAEERPPKMGLAPHEPVNITLCRKRLFANAIKLRILRQRSSRITPTLNASQVSS